MSRADTRGHVSPGIRESRIVTVMKADISGSTPLAEKLDPEDLRLVLGTYFAALAREIHWHGGTVDKYIGDAVLAAFGLPEPQPDDAERAVRAGLAMQRAIERENEALHARYGVRLACRIGLATGEVTGYPPTDRETAMFSVFGDTVQRAEWLEAGAPLGGVLVSGATREATSDAFSYDEPVTVSPKGGAPPIQGFRVLDASRAGGGRAGAAGATTSASLQVAGARADVLAEERKIVTVLFADLSSDPPLTTILDQDRLRDLLGTYFGVLAREIQRFGGTLDKYVGDAVMAVFGAPVSHEDDSARAIAAALAIQEAGRSLSEWVEGTHGVRIAIRIGINTGEVVAGMLPGEVHAYTVTGDTVNTAQRIESAAPAGAVYVSASTRALARNVFVYEELPPLTLKGKAEPVPAYRVVGRERRASPRGGPTLVGRATELAVLFAALRGATAGGGSLVHVYGEAGVGKTRLVAEFLTGVPRETARIRARCNSFESATPYALVADFIRRLFAIQASDDERSARSALETGAASLPAHSRASAVELFLEVLGYGDRSTLDPQAKRRLLVSLLRTFLHQRSSERVLVVLIEDLHWIDPTSANVLEDVMAEVAELRCAVVTTARTASSALPSATLIGVTPLDPTTAVELIDLIATAPIDDATRAHILERTGGNPFFIEEVVRSLKSDGITIVPATVQEVIEARLDRLDESPRRVAQSAAVIGRTFFQPLLARVEPHDDIAPALAALASERFISKIADGGEPTYSFEHALVQEVAYRTQLLSRRRQLHVTVGDAYGELFPDRREELIDTLAYHYRRGYDDVKARTSLVRAGQRALRLYAKDEAIDYFRDALARSADDPSTRAVAHEGIGDVLRIVASYTDALAAYGDALASRSDVELGADHARLLRKTGVIHTLTGASTRAVEVLETALAELASDEHAERSRILLQFAEIRWRAARYDDAIALLRDSVWNAQAAGDDVARAEALKQLGTVHVFKGDKRQGLRFYEESLALYDRADDPIGKAHVLNNMGATHDRLGAFEEARQAHEAAAAIRERIGDPFGIAQSRNNLGEVYRARGDLTRATENFLAALEVWRSIGHASVGLARTGIGITAIERGDTATARQELTTALSELEATGNRTYQLDTQRSLARAYLPDEPETALALAQGALAATQELGTADREGLAWQVLGLVREARGEHAEAIVALERGREMLAETGDRHELARTLVALARVYRELPDGDPRHAEVASLVAQARATFAAIGAALDLGRLEPDGGPA